MMTTTDQVENLKTNLLPLPKADDPTSPRIPFRTSYLLTREQEDAMIEHAVKRMAQIETQLGKDGESGGSSGAGNEVGNTRDAGGSGARQWDGKGYNPESFLGKRERLTQRYYSHVEDRALAGTVYEHSNLTLSLSQRITRQSIARTISFFCGQPDDVDWFSTEAVGVEDEAISDKIKKHSRWKVNQCQVKHRFIDWIEFARVRGEAVIKITHQKRGQIYKRTASILVAPKDAPEARRAREAGMQPGADGAVAMLDAHGDYIVQGDAFIDELAPLPVPAPVAVPEIGNTGEVSPQIAPIPTDSQVPEERPMPAPEMLAQSINEMASAPTGRKILKRDGVTVMPETPVWQEQVITRELITFEGPDAEMVDYRDFYFPINARDVQSADLVAHTYEKPLMDVVKMFRGQMGEGDAAIASLERAVERLSELAGSNHPAQSAAGQPRLDFQEENTDAARANPNCSLAEVFLTYDADGDGLMEEIFLLLDRTHKAPIYYEYLANVTVRGARPFYVIRPRAVDGRLYGMGDMEFFDPEQEFLDLQINRHNFRDSKAGTISFWDPSLTLEGDLDPMLRLNDGATYTKKAGAKTEDILSRVRLENDSESLEFLINLFMQMMQLKSGVLNGADRSVTHMPSSNTLGEEQLITESGDELFSHTISTLFPDVEAALGAVVDVIYANLNRTEVFNYFNGEANEILSLTPDDVRDLAMNVSLSLSRTQARKALETGEKAQAIVDWFYQLAPMLQERLANFARGRLKAMGVSQSDKIIEPVDPALMPGIDPATGQPLPAPAEGKVMPMPPATSAV